MTIINLRYPITEFPIQNLHRTSS